MTQLGLRSAWSGGAKAAVRVSSDTDLDSEGSEAEGASRPRAPVLGPRQRLGHIHAAAYFALVKLSHPAGLLSTLPISSPERIRLGGNEDFLAHPPPFGAMASSSANPVASSSPHGRWNARDAENVATNRASCNQRGQPRNQLVQWTPQGGSSVLQ